MVKTHLYGSRKSVDIVVTGELTEISFGNVTSMVSPEKSLSHTMSL